jgi:hypothetical protein
VARSADRRNNVLLTGAIAVVAAWAWSGCQISTTQDQDARLTVKAERTLVRAQDVKLGKPDPDVEVTRTSVVHGPKTSAIAVELRNTSGSPVNDLPIGVGIVGEDGYLNLQKGIRYFQSHVPAIGAGEDATWVFVSKDEIPDGKPFADVGSPADPPLTVAQSLPAVLASVAHASGDEDGGSVDLELSNDSDVPQFDLEVYAVARKGGEVVAAGAGSIDDLEGGISDSMKVALVGDPGDADVDVFAPPTIFK